MPNDLSFAPESQQLEQRLLADARAHACFHHPLFEFLRSRRLNQDQVLGLLSNYDAHACVLRRLLLKAATLMPEPAVGFVLENVRNEYGNGDYTKNHRQQLLDVATACGISNRSMEMAAVAAGVTRFIEAAPLYYYPADGSTRDQLRAAAISAGAITATELLAVEEFAAMHVAFEKLGVGHLKWFEHVTIERDHMEDSCALAIYFASRHDLSDAVVQGFHGILNANVDLYDGILAAMQARA